MKATKILNEEITDLKIASMPTRPTAPAAFGGGGYTPSELKAAFDRLPLFIIERFNALIEDILSCGEGSLADAIGTGISEGHTLASLFSDIVSGDFAAYLNVGGESLASALARINERLERENEQN